MSRINKLTERICPAKENCNHVCDPTSDCEALRYADRVIDAGYGEIDEITKDVVAEFDQALEGVRLSADAFERICDIKRRCGYTSTDKYSRVPVGKLCRLDFSNEVNELAKFIGDYNMQKGSIDERYLPYVQDVARGIVDAGWRKDQLLVKEIVDTIESAVNQGNAANALTTLWAVLDGFREKYGLETDHER